MVPITVANKEDWGALNYYSGTHLLCAESLKVVKTKFSFKGQHNVRLYRLKKNVHWKIPVGEDVDISSVMPSTPLRRRQRP